MPLLRITGLTKACPLPAGGEHRVAAVAEFSLAAVAQLALRGESGSVKTTFLHVIAGILAPARGSGACAGDQPQLVLAGERTGTLDRRNSRAALALIREVSRERSRLYVFRVQPELMMPP